jgi:hypothetical protein
MLVNEGLTMIHSCKQLQSELNFWFTQDQAPELPEGLRRQVTICPDCREHLQELKETLNLCKITQQDPQAQLQKSLWPQIQQRLQSQQATVLKKNAAPLSGRLMSAERTNVWSQRIALVSVSLALLTILSGPFFHVDQAQQASTEFRPQFEFARFDDQPRSRSSLFPASSEMNLYHNTSFNQARSNFDSRLNYEEVTSRGPRLRMNLDVTDVTSGLMNSDE